MPVRCQWPSAALLLPCALVLSLALVLVAPVPAGASACDLLDKLGACTPSDPEVVFTPEGLITLPGVGSSAPPAPPAPSSPTLLPDAARRLLDLANQERARVGAPALVFRDDVVRLAVAHTRKMIQGSGGGIFHNLDLLTKPLRQTLGALVVGENVGWSTHLEDLHPRLMASPPHRAALLDPRFTVAGFAVIHNTDGIYYVTQDFIQPSGAVPSPPAPPPTSGPPAPASDPVVTIEPAVAEETRERAPVDDQSEPPTVVDDVVPVNADQGPEELPTFASGEVAALIIEPPGPTPGRSGPLAVALILLATTVVGQGWWWFRASGPQGPTKSMSRSA